MTMTNMNNFISINIYLINLLQKVSMMENNHIMLKAQINESMNNHKSQQFLRQRKEQK